MLQSTLLLFQSPIRFWCLRAIMNSCFRNILLHALHPNENEEPWPCNISPIPCNLSPSNTLTLQNQRNASTPSPASQKPNLSSLPTPQPLVTIAIDHESPPQIPNLPWSIPKLLTQWFHNLDINQSDDRYYSPYRAIDKINLVNKYSWLKLYCISI